MKRSAIGRCLALSISLAIVLFTSQALSQTIEVTGHAVISCREIDLTFSHALKVGSGDNFANYTVFETGSPSNTIEIWGVWFGADHSTVRIVLYGPMEPAQSYTVAIDNVVATDDTEIAPGYEYPFSAIDAAAPGVLSAGFLSPRELEIIFTEDIVESEAEAIGSYILYQTGSPSMTLSVQYAQMRGVYDRVVLELGEDMSASTSYTVEASGLHDMAGNALPSPASLAFTYDGENDLPRIGLYADFDHVIADIDGDPLYSFDMWVWVKPGQDGAETAIFGVDYPLGVSAEPPQYNPELTITAFDIYNGGMVVFGSCRTGWTWICKQNIMVQGNNPGVISIFPVDDAGRQVAYCLCDGMMSIGRMEIASNLEYNSPDSRPIVVDASFHGLRTIDIVFNVPVTEATAEAAANYEIFETGAPSSTVGISAAMLLEDQVTVRLTADADLADLLEYTAVINGVERIEGASVRPDTEVEFAVLDEVAPLIASASMTGQKIVEVAFNEPVQESRAVSLLNYIFWENGQPVSNVIHTAVLLEDGSTVRLEMADPLEDGVEYTVVVSNVNDLRGNTIENGSEAGFIAEDIYPPAIERIWSAPGNCFRLVFDEDVDETTAGAISNYRVRISGGSSRTVAGASVEGNEVTLQISSPLEEYKYTVETRFIEDMNGNSSSDWVMYRYNFYYTYENPLPQVALYADAGRYSDRVDAYPMQMFSFYVMCNPGPNGIKCMTYRLQNISQENLVYYITGTEYDPGYSTSMGEPYTFFDVCIDACRTDWFWMSRYDAILIEGKGFIEIAPNTENFVPTSLTCDDPYPQVHLEVLNKLSINSEPEQVVGTALQSSSVVFRDGRVEIEWVMSDIDDGVEFRIKRSSESGEQVVLDPAGIERVGMTYSCVDEDIEPGLKYTYTIEFVFSGETRILFESDEVATPSMPVTLMQNKPNPFNPATRIAYYLPGRCKVKLEIFDVSGRSVAVLEDGMVERGRHEAVWTGLNSAGNRASSGIYFYRLTAGKETIAKKMVMLR